MQLDQVTKELIQSSQRLTQWLQQLDPMKQEMKAQTFLFDSRDYVAMFAIFDLKEEPLDHIIQSNDILPLLRLQETLLIQWLSLADELQESGEIRRQKASVKGILEFNRLLQTEYQPIEVKESKTVVSVEAQKNTTKNFWQRLFKQ